MKVSARQASRSIGQLIAAGERYEDEAVNKVIYQELLEYVINEIGEDFSREANNYAELIGFSMLVSLYIFHGVLLEKIAHPLF